MPNFEKDPREIATESAEEILARFRERGKKVGEAKVASDERERLLKRKEELLKRRKAIEEELAARKKAKEASGAGAPPDIPPETPPADDAPESSPDTSDDSIEAPPADDETPEDDSASGEASRESVKAKAKKNRALRTAITAAVLAGTIAIGSVAAGGGNLVRRLFGIDPKDSNFNNDPRANQVEVVDDADKIYAGIEQRLGIESNQYSGELSNGVHYDYNEYANTSKKVSKNAFGYDKSYCFGDPETTADSWMEMANKSPEYLSAYAYYALTDEEKAELGIAGMNSNEIDNYLSNADNIDGGEKQRKIFDALSQIAHDKENTIYEYYHENGTENSYYIVFQDKNNDGNYTPDELTLAYSEVKRNGAPQVDVYRIVNGEKIKVLDLNIECGFQPNMVVPPKDLPKIIEQTSETSISGQSISEPEIKTSNGIEPEAKTSSEIEPGIKASIGEAAQDPTPNHTSGGSSHRHRTTPNTPANTPKDTQKEIENAGPRATKLEQDKPLTPAPDSTTYEDIIRQKAEDKKKDEAAKKVAEDQSKAEAEAVVTAAKRNVENEKKEEQRLSGLSTEDRKAEEARQKANEEKADQALKTANQTTTENSRAQYEKESAANANAAAAEAAQAAANAAAEAISRQNNIEQSGGPSASERANMSF